MKRRILSLILSMVLLVSLMAPANAAPSGSPAQTESNGQPYYIMVNRQMNTITIYALDEQGYYSIPYKAMICSVGTSSLGLTPVGDFTLPGARWTWKFMSDVYGQYATWMWDDYLFHSIPFATKGKNNSLIISGYNRLGSPASHGCIRLLTQDAKWLYENCGKDTMVTIYDSPDPGPLGKPAKAISRLSGKQGWDPTDPDPNNPWKNKIATSMTLSQENLALKTGDTYQLKTTFSPAGGKVAKGSWVSSNPSAVTVNSKGSLKAVGAGKAVITCQFGALTGHCVVTVSGAAFAPASSAPASPAAPSKTPSPAPTAAPTVSPTAAPAASGPSAGAVSPFSGSVTVNGRQVNLPLYTLDGKQPFYVRLRDLGSALNGTSAQFRLGSYNGEEIVLPGLSYVPDGSEGTARFSGNPSSARTSHPVTAGNRQSNLSCLAIADYNGTLNYYYQLNALAGLLGFGVKAGGGAVGLTA